MNTDPLLGSPIDPLDDEVVAALAAVEAYIAAEQSATLQDSEQLLQQTWRDAAKLVVQGLQPDRTGVQPRWSTVERLRRAGRGGYGIVGL